MQISSLNINTADRLRDFFRPESEWGQISDKNVSVLQPLVKAVGSFYLKIWLIISNRIVISMSEYI